MEQSYKEKYDQAIERLKQWDREHPCAGYVLSDRDKFIFPELAENEDKTEKQGEQKASYTTMVETGDGGINALVTRELSADDVDKIVGMDLEDYL